jgi:hypothetical protein
MKYILGLDVSSKTIGVSVFSENGKLIELRYVAPKVKTTNKEDDILFEKSDIFKLFLEQRIEENPEIWLSIDRVFIEEPLLRSNNIYTIAKLLRFNGMISKCIWDILNIKPMYISSYDARKYAFPVLMQKNKVGKSVLFGAHPKDCDKKSIIWNLVCEKEPQIIWPLNKHSIPIKECYDMSDAYCVVLGAMRKLQIWE